MQFCMPHWESLKQAIDARGLAVLISEDGEEATNKLVSTMEEGIHLDNFDPLMSAHNSIFGNAVYTASSMGLDILVMLNPNSRPEYQCPICFLNCACKHHDEVCDEKDCPKGVTFDWMINRAADDALEQWQGMKP